MSILQAVILGIFQGIAEFLPISSSGHLVLLQSLFKIQEGNLFFTEMLHLGTLISIFIVYFNDIVKIIKEFFVLIYDLFKLKRLRVNNEYKKLGLMIIIGSIPTGIIGVLFSDFFEGLYNSVTLVGLALIVTGILLWIAEKLPTRNKKVIDMKISDALFVGLFQGIAITPGISRSGSTIVGGLFRGFNKKLATKFSFLLALPATFGAALLGLKDALSESAAVTIDFPLILGIAISAITGIIAIKFLIKVLEKGKLHYFSYYLWIIGAIIIIRQFF